MLSNNQNLVGGIGAAAHLRFNLPIHPAPDCDLISSGWAASWCSFFRSVVVKLKCSFSTFAKGEYTEDSFSISQPETTEKVVGVLDAINGRWGRGTIRLASVSTDPDWGMRREMMSQSLTTRGDQLWTVYCR